MIRLVAAAAFMVMLPMMAVTGAALLRAHKAADWVKHIIVDRRPDPKPQTPGRKFWRREENGSDVPPWL